MPEVSVLIVSWNDRPRLARCLAALTDDGLEIIVVDNASRDGSADMVAATYPGARLVRADRNLGFAGGVNTAAAAATGRYLLLLNPDTVAEPGAVGILAAFLDTHAEAAGAAGLLFGNDGAPQVGWNVRRLPTPLALATELLLLDRLWPRNPVARRHNALDVDLRVPGPVEQPAAACLMLTRRAFDALGGLDEQFHPAWFEDVDFCARLRARSGRLYLVPAARFLHEGGASRRQLSQEEYTRFYYRNLLRFVHKHWGAGWWRVCRVMVALGLLVRSAASLAAGNRRGATAYLSVLRQGEGPCSPRRP